MPGIVKTTVIVINAIGLAMTLEETINDTAEKIAQSVSEQKITEETR